MLVVVDEYTHSEPVVDDMAEQEEYNQKEPEYMKEL